MTDKQLLIIKIYHYLQKLARNFVRAVKYAFDTYNLEVNSECTDNDLLKLAASRLIDDKEIVISDTEAVNEQNESERDPLPEISTQDFDIPCPCDLIDNHVAEFIISRVYRGDCLSPTGWLNDECINYYLEYILRPLSIELQQNIKFLSTHFFKSLFFKNKIPEAVNSYAFNFDDALPYWQDDEVHYMIPINILDEHWTSIILDKFNQTMWYYDSLGSYKNWDGAHFLEMILLFVQQYDRVCVGHSSSDWGIDEWTLLSSKDMFERDPKSSKFKNVPQKNGHDCEIFVLKYV